MIKCSNCQADNRDAARYCASCASPLNLQGKYRIVRSLGRGGFGVVYLAEHLELSASAAIKELALEPDTALPEREQAEKQFRVEASLLAKLGHPTLPKVWNYFSENNRNYLVMEYIEGETLDERLTRAGAPLLEAEVLYWAKEICDVLTYLHSQQPPVIHRDIKPHNILITQTGALKLLDFGIAKVFVAGRTTEKGAEGISPPYSPVEQYGGTTDARSDLYALGVTMYQVLTNQLPPAATDRGTQVVVPPRRWNRLLSTGIEVVILKAMAINPNDRFQTTLEIKLALSRIPVGGLSFKSAFMVVSNSVHSQSMILMTWTRNGFVPWLRQSINSAASWIRRGRSVALLTLTKSLDAASSWLKRISRFITFMASKFRNANVPLWMTCVFVVGLIGVALWARQVSIDQTHETGTIFSTLVANSQLTIAAQRNEIADVHGTAAAQATEIARATVTIVRQGNAIANLETTNAAQASEIAKVQGTAAAQANEIAKAQVTMTSQASDLGNAQRTTTTQAVENATAFANATQIARANSIAQAQLSAIVPFYVPQKCDINNPNPDFGPIQPRTQVIILPHRSLDGNDTGAPVVMDPRVGRTATVTGYANPRIDAQGCPLVLLDIDSGNSKWRIRDLALQ